MGLDDDLGGWCQIYPVQFARHTQYFVGIEWTDMPLGDQLRYVIPDSAGPDYACDSGWMQIDAASDGAGNGVGNNNANGVSTTLTLLYRLASAGTVGPYLGTLTVVPAPPRRSGTSAGHQDWSQWFVIDAIDQPAEVQIGAQCDGMPPGGEVRWVVQGAAQQGVPQLDSGWRAIGAADAAITEQTDWPAMVRPSMGIYYRPSPTATAKAVAEDN